MQELWMLFRETGAPEFYLAYKQAKDAGKSTL